MDKNEYKTFLIKKELIEKYSITEEDKIKIEDLEQLAYERGSINGYDEGYNAGSFKFD